jgi:formyltetrahydrofolate deformylase
MKQFANITVIGRDKTGVIARVTAFLFERKANIEALEEQVTRGQFSMTIQASWRLRDWRVEELQAGLDALARALGMEIKLRFTEPRRRPIASPACWPRSRPGGCPKRNRR